MWRIECGEMRYLVQPRASYLVAERARQVCAALL